MRLKGFVLTIVCFCFFLQRANAQDFKVTSAHVAKNFFSDDFDALGTKKINHSDSPSHLLCLAYQKLYLRCKDSKEVREHVFFAGRFVEEISRIVESDVGKSWASAVRFLNVRKEIPNVRRERIDFLSDSTIKPFVFNTKDKKLSNGEITIWNRDGRLAIASKNLLGTESPVIISGLSMDQNGDEIEILGNSAAFDGLSIAADGNLIALAFYSNSYDDYYVVGVDRMTRKIVWSTRTRQVKREPIEGTGPKREHSVELFVTKGSVISFEARNWKIGLMVLDKSNGVITKCFSSRMWDIPRAK